MSDHSNVEPIDRIHETRIIHPPNEVRVVLALDRSGSMKPHEALVTEALGNFFGMLRDGLPAGSRCLLTWVQFDSTVEVCALKQPLETVPVRYQAVDGTTSLWDGVCSAMRLETSRQVPVLALFITDGEENASQFASSAQARAMVETREEWGNWRFYYLNLQGHPSRSAAQLRVQSIDSTPAKMGEALASIAPRMCRDLARLLSATADRPLLEGGR